ncbi:MAG: NAD(P)H-dependent oxidoreductase [Betaproteobacteria bacterium]|nr:NAD(P)H-dependent oxidoreductase [Betaproteobacteria bacterium]
MAKRITLVQGHPDATEQHLCHRLAQAYAEAARSAGHEVRIIDVGALDFPVLRSRRQWYDGALPLQLESAQESIAWCEHLVLFFPLWLGDMPALLKAFLEQIARPGFAVPRENAGLSTKLLSGRSARVVVTMGMPAMLYRYYFRAHSIKSLERNILGFVGFAPVDETLIGSVEGLGEAGVRKWCNKMRALARA